MLIWCNKQELNNAIPIESIEYELGLGSRFDKKIIKNTLNNNIEKIGLNQPFSSYLIDIIVDYLPQNNNEWYKINERPWKIMGCNCMDGTFDGMYEGLQWIAEQNKMNRVVVNHKTRVYEYSSLW